MSEIHRDRVAVVINGNAKDVTRELVDILDQIVASGDLFVSRSLEEGREIARDIVARGYQTVLTGGGDGTFSQMVTAVVRGCREQGRPLPRFGLLRLGTGNSLAWVLGASKSGVVGRRSRCGGAGPGRSAVAVGRSRLLQRHGNGVRAVLRPDLGWSAKSGVVPGTW